MKISCIAIVLFLVCQSVTTLAQQTIYVNNLEGSDSNSGLSPTSGMNGPKRNIAAALQVVTTGDTISVASVGRLYTDSVVVTQQIVIVSTGGVPEVEHLKIALGGASALLEFAGPFKVRTLELQEGKVKGSDKLTMATNGKVIRRSPTAVLLGQLTFEGKVDLEHGGEKDITMGLEAPSAAGGEIDTLGLSFAVVSPVPRLTLQRSIAARFVRFVNGLLVTDTNYVQMDNPVGTVDQGFVREVLTGARSHVVGNVRKTLKAGVIIAFGRNEFPVGDSLYYRPAAITIVDSTGNSSTGVALTVKHVNSWVMGVVGLPVSDLLFCDINMIAPFYWKVSSSGSLGQTPFHLELTATAFRDFSDVSNLRIIRRSGTENDVTNAWVKQSSQHDSYSIGGEPTISAVNSVGGIETAGAVFTIGWYHGDPVSNPISPVVLSESVPIYTRKLSSPPVFPAPCGGYKGTLTFSALVADSNVAKATIVSNDTLVITRGTKLGTTNCTLTGTDSFDGSRISLKFSVTNKSSTAVEDDVHSTPSTFVLRQNYPNPFNPRTSLEFHVPSSGFVEIKVFDVLGRETAVLVSEEKSPGIYRVTWDAKDLPSGLYLYRMRAGSFVDAKKMLLIR